jgi:UDP-glucuronate 4-epimerase
MRFLVTGTAGFIGFHLAQRLLDEGHEVTGIDGFTTYYDVSLKERRHSMLASRNNFRGHRIMLEDRDALAAVWGEGEIDVVIHLAGQAGVRYSIENPRAYVDANIVGTFNLLELVQQRPVRHFMFASTSSIYGANESIPFRETDRADHPLTIYAASKKAAEATLHCYSHLWKIPVTAFRFFTVYGPWGRPDMAFFKFTKSIIDGQPIDIYNHGDMERDFTYVADLVEAIWRLVPCMPGAGPAVDPGTAQDSLSPVAPFRVVNIGAGRPVRLLDFIAAIESAVGRPALRNYLPMQPGDVPRTFADNKLLAALTGYVPKTSVSEGMKEFVAWYCTEYSA